MPAPITIRDPATYYESRIYPSAALGLGEDPVVPLRKVLSELKTGGEQPSSGDDETLSESIQRNESHMNDIGLSPRLLGYVFSCISSAVSMISSTIFLLRGTTLATGDNISEYFSTKGIAISDERADMIGERIEDMSQRYELHLSSGGYIVRQWKVYGCIAVSALLTVITVSIVIAHFDSIFCVKQNRIHFHDGSKFERNLLLLLIVLSACSLHISTSKFSVGEAQANVFFSTWTNFISCVVNYEVWRKGSGRHLSFQNVLFGERRYWFLLSIFTTIAFLSTIDFFMTNNIVKNTDNSDCLDLSWDNQWIWFVFAGTMVCWVIVLCHRCCMKALVVKILEACVSLVIIGVYGYFVAAFSGGRLDQIPIPSNLYFSVWGVFFLSVWIFSTMIQERRSRIEEST